MPDSKKKGLLVFTLLVAIALVSGYAFYFRKYEIRYDQFKAIKSGQTLPLVLTTMGIPDTTYAAVSPDGKYNLLVYQYNMNFIAPDDIRILFLDGKVYDTIYNK